jgi:hypothetical protein
VAPLIRHAPHRIVESVAEFYSRALDCFAGLLDRVPGLSPLRVFPAGPAYMKRIRSSSAYLLHLHRHHISSSFGKSIWSLEFGALVLGRLRLQFTRLPVHLSATRRWINVTAMCHHTIVPATFHRINVSAKFRAQPPVLKCPSFIPLYVTNQPLLLATTKPLSMGWYSGDRSHNPSPLCFEQIPVRSPIDPFIVQTVTKSHAALKLGHHISPIHLSPADGTYTPIVQPTARICTALNLDHHNSPIHHSPACCKHIHLPSDHASPQYIEVESLTAR